MNVEESFTMMNGAPPNQNWGMRGDLITSRKGSGGGTQEGGGTAPHPNLPQNEVFRVSPADPKTHKKILKKKKDPFFVVFLGDQR